MSSVFSGFSINDAEIMSAFSIMVVVPGELSKTCDCKVSKHSGAMYFTKAQLTLH